MQQSTVILITLLIYKVTLIGIGLWASRRTHNQTDFFLAGRGLGPWVAGLSYAASTSSAWLLLGFSGFVFAAGLSALWMVPGIWAGYIVVWLVLGPRLRAESLEQGWITPSDFLSANTHGWQRASINGIAALLIIFCFVFYIAAQFDAAARAFTANFDMSYAGSVMLGALIILAYCLLGGFWAVSLTDTLQGVVMVLAALIVPAFAVVAAGGPGEVLAGLNQPQHVQFMSWSGGHGGMVLMGLMLGLASIGLGTLGQPHLLSRLMAVRGERERKQGFAIAMTWGVLVYIGMTTLALSARSAALEPGDGEQLFYVAAAQFLPPVFAGIIIAAVLSAVMSTVDSVLLAASAAVAHDMGIARRLPGRELMVSRIVMTGITALAVVLALNLPDSIFNRVLFAWSALGAAFGPIVLARVAGLEPAGSARLAAMVSGFGLTVLFYAAGGTTLAAGEQAGWLVQLGKLPGDPFERLIPWLPALAIVFFGPRQGPLTAPH